METSGPGAVIPQCQPTSTKAGIYNPAPKLLLGGDSWAREVDTPAPSPTGAASDEASHKAWCPRIHILSSLAAPGPSEPISLPLELPPSHPSPRLPPRQPQCPHHAHSL